MNLEEKLKENIEANNLKPKSKWNFILKNWFIWVLGLVTVTVGAICVSLIIFIFKNIKFEYSHITHDNPVSFLLEFLPSLWILLLILFVYLADILLQKTNRGYKYNILIISSFAVLYSVVFGSVLYGIGFAEIIDENLDSNFSFYSSINEKNKDIWLRPEKGLLFGEITKGKSIQLKTRKGDIWDLDVTGLSTGTTVLLENGEQVRVVGQKLGDSVFYTCVVIPYEKEESSEDVDQISENERNENGLRSIRCKGVRPYERLQN